MKYLRELQKEDLEGKRVLLRSDFNVPMKDGEIVGDFRILKSLPTIEFLRDAGAKIIIISHMGGENGKTLAPVSTYLSKYTDIVFAPDMRSSETRHVIDMMQNGDAVLLENLRNDPGEKGNSEQFAQFLASFADIYVNDAFSASHREHASIVGVPKFLPAYAGLLMEEEIKSLSKVFNPPRPFLFILGGAKFDTKLPLLKKFLKVADYIFIGGALAHNMLQKKGLQIGKSVISDGVFDIADLVNSDKVFLPTEVIVQNGEEVLVKQMENVFTDDKIVDAGEGTLKNIKVLLDKSKFVLWNGPLGYYEGGFDEGTHELAQMISEAKADSLVGGGDTLTAIQKMGVEDGFETISTAGGAMLDYLLDEKLPGIEALEK